MKRCFVFFYSFGNASSFGFGTVHAHSDEAFPCESRIKEKAATQGNFKPSHVQLTGWKEMSENDYKNFSNNSSQDCGTNDCDQCPDCCASCGTEIINNYERGNEVFCSETCANDFNS